MKLKMKNSILLDDSFLKVLGYFFKQKLPIALSYQLEKCVEVIAKEELRVKKTKEDSIVQYGTKKVREDQTEYYQVEKENQEAYFNELVEFLNLEFELPIEDKINVSIVEMTKRGVDLSGEDMQRLKLLMNFVD